MNKRGAGIALISIAAFLFSSRYICAAILQCGRPSNAQGFRMMLGFVGAPLLILSIAAFIAGIVYMILGEKKALK